MSTSTRLGTDLGGGRWFTPSVPLYLLCSRCVGTSVVHIPPDLRLCAEQVAERQRKNNRRPIAYTASPNTVHSVGMMSGQSATGASPPPAGRRRRR